MGMAGIGSRLILLVILFFLNASGTAFAQTNNYDVLIDLDRNPATGCDIAAPNPVSGVERRIRASVDASTATVISVSVEICAGTSFGAPIVVGGPHPVGLNTGVNASDVVELSAPFNTLDLGSSNPLQLIFRAADGTGSDLLGSVDGGPNGGPILFGLPISVPTLSAAGIALLAVILFLWAWRHHRRSATAISMVLLLLAAGLVVAVNFITDGNIGDWIGEPVRATDPIGDASNGNPGNDIQAAFFAAENASLFFRLDITDIESQSPLANDDSFALDEDTTLNASAPGVLANDTDPGMATLSAVLITGPSNAASFILNTDGSFSYQPAANFNGSDSFTYVADNGATTSNVATVSLLINPINDPPVAIDDTVTTNEDSATVIAVLGNDSDVDGTLDPSSVTVTTAAGNGATLVNPATGEITYTKNPDFNGNDSFQYQVCDTGTPLPALCATANVNITVNPVNDAPSFTVGPDQTVLEDSGAQTINGWATAISAGPANEAGQALSFIFSGNTNPTLFAAGPAVDAAGNLSFTPAADANGSADLSLFLMDDGGTANGGVDSSATVSFTISISAVNDAPSFVAGPNQTALEDSGAQTVNGWATAISAGPADEAGQTLSFNIAGNDNPGLFSVAPSVDSAGNLSYTPAANASGVANIMLTLSDNGGTANGGADTSAATLFSITISEVNDAPFFSAGVNPSVDEDSGAQSLAWASGISAGPANEAGQVLNFVLTPVSVDSTLSFSTGPSVNTVSGNVEFTAAANAYGAATYNVVLQDNGGTANGGVDVFGPLSLTITVNPLNDAPSVSAAPSYSASTNIQLDIPAGSGLLLNASDETTEAGDPNGPGIPGTVLTAGNGANPLPVTTTNGGNLSINAADGSFSYNPPPGFTGVDNFTYVVCDNGIGIPASTCSAPVNVNITVSGPTVWFIDNNVSGGANNGRLSSPFESLAAFNARQGNGGVADPAPGDFIFLTSSATAYSDGANGITLSDDQTLFGQGTTGISFDALTGLTPPAGSVARPALGGASPVLTSTSSAVSLATAAASTNTLRGFTIGDTNTGYGLSGTMAGTLNVLEVDIQGQGGLVNLDGAGSGILNASFTAMNSVAAQSTSFILQNFAGGILNSSSTSIQVPAAGAIQISNNNPATQINFGTLANLSTTAGPGFLLNSAGTVSINGSPSLSSIGGPALQISATNVVGFDFSSLSANGSVNGINLDTVVGNISAAAGIIQNSSAVGISINSGSNDVSFAGDVMTSLGRAVVISNHTGGTISIGNITNTTQGIQLTNNPGTLIRFIGNIALTTGANTAFNATGGGVLEAIGVNSIITTTTGTAVDINGVNFSPNNFTLRTVNTNGGVNGIRLVNTGNTGGFTVAGDGSNARNGSGGTIQNTTGDGMVLQNANNVRLSSVNFTNVGDSSDTNNGGNTLATNDHAIQSEGGGSIILSGVHIANPAAGGWEAVDLGGNNRIDNNSLIEGINVSNMQALEVRNTDTNMPGFVINNSQFANQAATNGSSYVLFSGFGTSNMTVRVENNSSFNNVFGQALQANSGEGVAANGAVDLTIVNSSFTNAVDGTVGIGASGGIGGVIISAREDATHTFNISNNTWNDLGRPLANAGLLTVQGIGGLNKLLDGVVAANNVDRIGYPTSAEITTAVGHRFLDAVTENDITRLDLEIDNNDVDDTSREAYFASSRGDSRDFDLAVTNNRLGQVVAIGQTDRETIEILSEDNSDMEAIISNNLITGNTGIFDEVVDIDTENTSFMDMIFTGNTVSNLQAAGGLEIVVDTENGTSTHCMRFINNTAAEVEFDVAGLHNIEDFANITANNPGVGAFIDGVGVTNVAVNTCISPSF